jgi:hypothetical protein
MSTASRSILVDRGPVSLGCGTLILIALIVMIFSNASRQNCNTIQLELEVQRLASQIGVLRDSIERQNNQLIGLEQEIRRTNKAEPHSTKNQD